MVLRHRISESACLGVWKITESAATMLDDLHLDEDDRNYAGTFKNDLRKKHWLGYRMILREILPSSRLKIIYDDCGKPLMPFFEGSFSVSHSGDFAAAIASSEADVGIDIEKIRDRVERVAERFLSEEELEWAGTGDRIEKMTICWGAKESLYKTAGNPDLDFREDMRLEPFDYLCIGEGSFKARMKAAEGHAAFNVFYRKIEDYMLVWAVCDPMSVKFME